MTVADAAFDAVAAGRAGPFLLSQVEHPLTGAGEEHGPADRRRHGCKKGDVRIEGHP